MLFERILAGQSRQQQTIPGFNILDNIPDEAFDTITELAARTFNVPIALIVLTDPTYLWIKSAYGLKISEKTLDPETWDTIIRTSQLYFIPDSSLDPNLAANPLVTEVGLRFYAAAPLLTQDGYNLGTICLIDKKSRFLADKDLRLLNNLTRMTVDQLELYNFRQLINLHPNLTPVSPNGQQPNSDLSRQVFLFDQIRSAIALEVDLKELCRIVVQSVAKTFGYSQVSLYLIENDWLAMQYQVGYDMEISYIPLGRGVMGRTARSRQAALVADVKADPDFIEGLPGVCSEICVPILDQGYVIGVLNIETTQNVVLTEADFQLILALSEHINPAIGRARLFKEALAREQFLSSIYNGVEEVIFVVDVMEDGTIRYAGLNPAAEKVGGTTSTEWQGKTLDEVWPAITAREIMQRYSKCVETKETLNFEEFLPVKDGFRWRLTKFTPLLNAEERVYRVIGTGTDITRLKQIEEQLSAEKERLGVTLSSIGDGVVTTNNFGKITLINEVAEDLIGTSQSLALGRPLSELFQIVDQKSNDLLESPLTQVLEQNDVILFPDNTLLLSQKHRELFISGSAAPIHDKDGQIIGVVLVFRDITEKQRLAEEQLKASKLESLGILAGGIAHDFNNILTAILGNLSLASDSTQPGEELHMILEEAEKASIRAKSLTQQLLTFAKGGSPIKTTALLPEIIRESAQFAARGSGVECEIYLPENLWPVEVDQGQLSQVVHNLIINAIQAMKNSGMIKVSAKNFYINEGSNIPLKPGKFVQLIFQDNGSGISSENLSRIFDPYYTTKPQGSGLGLAISYSIIKKHDGHIAVKSQLGKGTVFYLYLPASQKVAAVLEDKSQPIPQGHGRILIMDDAPSIRQITTKILTKVGYEVEAVPDGKEAIRRYAAALKENKPFDAVIMDLTIPGGMGGQEAVKHLLELNPQAKVLVSSGYNNDPVLADFKEHGFAGVVVKPYTQQTLSRVLHELLKTE